MRLAISNDFALTVLEAFDMLTDPAFLDAVALASHPVSHELVVDGGHITTRRTLESAPPLRTFTGPTIKVVEQTWWDEPSADKHQRTGRTQVTVEGLPGDYTARVRLHAGGRGALLEFDGELTVRVPIFGPKVEQMAAPLLTDAATLQQQVADGWIAKHR